MKDMVPILLPIMDPEMGKKFDEYAHMPPKPEFTTEEEKRELIAFVHEVASRNSKETKE